MRQIAEAAGVSKPLLYHYFPSKDDLFIAAVTEAASELQALIEPSGEGTPVEQLTATASTATWAGSRTTARRGRS